MTVDRAIELLGGSVNGHDVLNGHDLLAGHASRDGLALITRPRRGWSWYQRDQRHGQGERRALSGSRLIGTGGVLLFLLGSGLLAVSFAAQYQYVLRERQQHVASLIEAGALDVGLIIFSLLALGLARAGLSAKIERAAVVGCALGSAVMNYAAADVTSPRSVLAYCMPPVFLAFVVDRVVRTIQRHVLGMIEGRSPWAVLADAARRVTRFWVLSVLYVLRFLVDRRNTCAGLKQAILNATPLPQAPERRAVEAPRESASEPAVVSGKSADCVCPLPYSPGGPVPCVASGRCMRPRQDKEGSGGRPERGNRRPSPQRPRIPSDTKTEHLLALVTLRRGDLAGIPLDHASKIATAYAPEVDMHPASARTALLNAVRAAKAAGEGDAR